MNNSKQFRVVRNPDAETVRRVVAAVKSNDGYCPCVLFKTEDTKCMCKEFNEKDTEGLCRCGLFLKEKI